MSVPSTQFVADSRKAALTVDLKVGRIRDAAVVAGAPSNNKHHFTILAVPDAAGAAVASNDAIPDTT
jgi:hypothetical protein